MQCYPGCLPPLASVTAVRVVNFTTYNWAKHAISDTFQSITGESPLEEYKKPGSTPSVAGILTFTGAGLLAGLVTSPLACTWQSTPLQNSRTILTVLQAHSN